MNIKGLKSVLAKIEKSKNIVSKERDKLRELHGELEMILESFDEGIDQLNAGQLEIENAINTISQYA